MLHYRSWTFAVLVVSAVLAAFTLVGTGAQAQDVPVTAVHRRSAGVMCKCTDTAVVNAIALRLALRGQLPDTTMMPGFYRPTAPVIPAAVARSARSTFKLLFPWDFQVMPTADYPRLAARLAQTKDNDEKRIAGYYHRRCVVRAVETCSIPMTTAVSTGYVAREGRSLYMSGHFLRDTLLRVRPQSVIVNRTAIPFFVYDSNNVLIVSPLDSQITIKELGAGDPTLKAAPASDDYVVLQMPVAIAPPIPTATRLTVGEPTYAMGFPGITNGDTSKALTAYDMLEGSRSPFPDADGDNMHVSIGNLRGRDVTKIMQYERRMRGTMPAGMGDYGRIDTSTNDGNAGISGGPVVNARGELLGMVALQSVNGRSGPALSYLQFMVRPRGWPPLVRAE